MQRVGAGREVGGKRGRGQRGGQQRTGDNRTKYFIQRKTLPTEAVFNSLSIETTLSIENEEKPRPAGTFFLPLYNFRDTCSRKL